MQIGCPFCWHGLTLILAWISIHMPSKVWDKISDPFPNFNGSAVEVWEWRWGLGGDNFIPHIIKLIHVSKRGPRCNFCWISVHGLFISYNAGWISSWCHCMLLPIYWRVYGSISQAQKPWEGSRFGFGQRWKQDHGNRVPSAQAKRPWRHVTKCDFINEAAGW